jgi:hypothetical protein
MQEIFQLKNYWPMKIIFHTKMQEIFQLKNCNHFLSKLISGIPVKINEAFQYLLSSFFASELSKFTTTNNKQNTALTTCDSIYSLPSGFNHSLLPYRLHSLFSY